MLVFTLGLCLGFSDPLSQWEPDSSITLVETSGYRGHPRFLRTAFCYVNLVYDGVAEAGVRADVARIPLRGESVDIVLSSDVFEHVRDDVSGFSEIVRVLRPGGHFILEVPAVGELEQTRVLVEARGDEDVFLAPPEYHAEHTLVYRYYGNDVLDRLRALGLSVLLFRGRVPANCITEQSVVIGEKAPYISLGPRVLRDRAWS